MDCKQDDIAAAVGAMFTEAIRHHQLGGMERAERLYRQVLAADPGHAGALHLLGVLAYQTGRSQVAADLIRKAIAIAPDVAMYHSDLGLALHALGCLDEAKACHRQAIACDPGYAAAYYNLGLVAQDLGQLDDAIAAYRTAIGLRPDLAEAHNNLGLALHAQGFADEAATSYRNALRVDPGSPEAHNNLGNLLAERGCFEEAADAFRTALDHKPDCPEIMVNMAKTLRQQGRPDLAIPFYQRAAELEPGQAQLHCDLAGALLDMARVEEALSHFAAATRLDPDHAPAHGGMGLALAFLGRLGEAEEAHAEAIRLDPSRGAQHADFAAIHHYVPGDSMLALLEQWGRSDAETDDGNRMAFHYALAKAYDDVGRYDEAFAHLLAGNALKRRQMDYDEAAQMAYFRRIRQVFSAEFIAARSGQGHDSSVPIFIVGMPRSGTTLVEQILASHPQVFGAGELAAVENMVARLSGPDGAFPEMMAVLPAGELARLGTEYVDIVSALAPGSMRLVDKMPHNFVHVGLIHLMLPRARILHVRRDPVDTCLSCFSKDFSHQHPYKYDLGELGRYYRAYEELMAHWHQVLPAGIMIDVDYEEVVADLPGQVGRILAHCGLGWDDACLAFHATRRTVRSASAAQVRQPVYGSAVGRWRSYARFLAPLLSELGVDA